jgi:hypothetical protein
VEVLAGKEQVDIWTFYVARSPPSSARDSKTKKITIPVGPDGNPAVLFATTYLKSIDAENARIELMWFNMSHKGKHIEIEPIVCPYDGREVLRLWKGVDIWVSYSESG